MQHLEVSCAVRPILWPLSVKWLKCQNSRSCWSQWRECDAKFRTIGS